MNSVEQRLNRALILEKHFNPERIRSVIKSDIMNVLKNYGEIEAKDLDFDIIIDDDGSYEVQFKARLNRIKVIKSF